MFHHTHLEHRFVQYIPEQLEPGIIYISMQYATAAHGCCCGCGEQVITPFTPTDWKLTFDGETVSLWPSIGNWNFACRSHYIIRRSQIIGAEPWDDERIDGGRRRNKGRKEKFYGKIENTEEPQKPTEKVVGEDLGLWDRLKRKVRKNKRRR
jgi:hypothetical protein